MKVLLYFRQSQNVSREKLREALSYKQRAQKNVDEIDTCLAFLTREEFVETLNAAKVQTLKVIIFITFYIIYFIN